MPIVVETTESPERRVLWKGLRAGDCCQRGRSLRRLHSEAIRSLFQLITVEEQCCLLLIFFYLIVEDTCPPPQGQSTVNASFLFLSYATSPTFPDASIRFGRIHGISQQAVSRKHCHGRSGLHAYPRTFRATEDAKQTSKASRLAMFVSLRSLVPLLCSFLQNRIQGRLCVCPQKKPDINYALSGEHFLVSLRHSMFPKSKWVEWVRSQCTFVGRPQAAFINVNHSNPFRKSYCANTTLYSDLPHVPHCLGW